MIWFIIFVVFILCVTGTILAVLAGIWYLTLFALRVALWLVMAAVYLVCLLAWCCWYPFAPAKAMAQMRIWQAEQKARAPRA
jgi:hypothetical protein